MHFLGSGNVCANQERFLKGMCSHCLGSTAPGVQIHHNEGLRKRTVMLQGEDDTMKHILDCTDHSPAPCVVIYTFSLT